MPLALILSSYVAASRIGGGAQQYVLAADRIDPVLVPTVLLGRSPAHGAPGGGATPAGLFEGMLQGVEADGIFGLVDLVITGHFSLVEQVRAAARTIAAVRAAPRGGAFAAAPVVVVDPILGDEPKGLYVKPEVARAVADELVPLADWITPNAWELTYLSGQSVADAAGAVDAARRVGRAALVTSIPAGEGRIGLVLAEPAGAVLISHPKAASAPNGVGDLVTASFGSGLTLGLEPQAAAERAARAVAQAVRAAGKWNAPELPLVALGERLARPSGDVAVERLA